MTAWIRPARIGLGAGLLAIAVLASGTPQAAAQTVIKLAHTEAEGDLLKNPYWAYTEVFNRTLENETNGRYKLQVFPNKQLGDLESLAEQTARGTIHMAAGLSAGHLSSYFPSIQVLEMPYTFPSIEVGRIAEGLVVLVGVTHTDGPAEADKLADKLWHLRVMADDEGVMNRSVADTTRALLLVSQFTLYGDTSGGRRPSWSAAARPEQAEPLFDRVVERLRALGAEVATGRFRTHMQVSLVNDGPATLLVET